jgi:endonuclease/exonuclease/phosphatase family metal-dependent hydrolase
MIYRIRPLFLVVVVLVFAFAPVVRAESITVATYNVEHFESHFEAFRISRTPEGKGATGMLKDVLDLLKKENDEDNWEVAEVITDKAFSPDVLVIEEGCSQSNLTYFNKRWLHEAYETAIVFPTNTDRQQNLCMLLKPGFKILARKDKYYEEKDTGQNARGERLFARGPAFCLVQTPGGYRFWVGVTHQKSKAGNSVEVTAWRNREAIRTHEIMKELQQAGPDDVMLLGDMNDDLGEDQYEKDPKSGGDAIPHLVGPPADHFFLATEPLAKSGEISFGGYWNTKYRSLIDHVVTTPSMKDQIESVSVFKGSLTAVASDHYPVMVKVRCDEPSKNGRKTAAQPAPVR